MFQRCGTIYLCKLYVIFIYNDSITCKSVRNLNILNGRYRLYEQAVMSTSARYGTSGRQGLEITFANRVHDRPIILMFSRGFWKHNPASTDTRDTINPELRNTILFVYFSAFRATTLYNYNYPYKSGIKAKGILEMTEREDERTNKKTNK